jgi:hypothetical protein
MAERALLRIGRPGPTAEQRKREEQYHRKNLRIAIRQLERAELYLVAVDSLDLEDREAKRSAREIVEHLRGLRRYLLDKRSNT